MAEDHESAEQNREPPPIFAGRARSPSGLISHDARRCDSDTRIQFSECSLAVQALGLGPRRRECESRRSDHFQVRGPVSGAPAREAGEVGASPTHLTSLLLVEMKESTERSGDGAAAGGGQSPERERANQPFVEGKSVGASPITSASFGRIVQ